MTGRTIPNSSVVMHTPAGVEVLVPGGRVLSVPSRARDRYGSVVGLLRLADPHPGYTRHALGELELARDHRRHRQHH